MRVPLAAVVPAAAVVALAALGVWLDAPSTSSAPAQIASIDDSTATDRPSTTAAPTTAPTTAAPTTAGAPPTTTSCEGVVHIGDSTSVGLVSDAFIDDPSLQMDSQYRRVGVTDVHLEISGARSVVERYRAPNGPEVASELKANGYEGCWVMALGVTDSANVAAGSPILHTERIDRMMAVIGDDPVLWLTVKTLDTETAWAGRNMPAWNEALVAAQARYPNIILYDWAAIVDDDWFDADGIHYTSEGCVIRARLIADALVTAYPA